MRRGFPTINHESNFFIGLSVLPAEKAGRGLWVRFVEGFCRCQGVVYGYLTEKGVKDRAGIDAYRDKGNRTQS